MFSVLRCLHLVSLLKSRFQSRQLRLVSKQRQAKQNTMLRSIHWCGSMCYHYLLYIGSYFYPSKNFFSSHIASSKPTSTDTYFLKLQDQEIPWTDWSNYERRGGVDLYHGWKEVMEQTTYPDGIPGNALTPNWRGHTCFLCASFCLLQFGAGYG